MVLVCDCRTLFFEVSGWWWLCDRIWALQSLRVMPGQCQASPDVHNISLNIHTEWLSIFMICLGTCYSQGRWLLLNKIHMVALFLDVVRIHTEHSYFTLLILLMEKQTLKCYLVFFFPNCSFKETGQDLVRLRFMLSGQWCMVLVSLTKLIVCWIKSYIIWLHQRFCSRDVFRNNSLIESEYHR